MNIAVTSSIHKSDTSRLWRTSAESRSPALLAGLATHALLEEAELTPKPALVDRRGRGAHRDLSLELMQRSARVLRPTFEAIARAAWRRELTQEVREEIAEVGRAGETRMLAATGGSNTHKGAIWALGLLVAAAAARRPVAVQTIAAHAKELAHHPDRFVTPAVTHGLRVVELYGVSGARGEAQRGFPHVVRVGLPRLIAARHAGLAENEARLDALLAIMAQLDDTCLLHRGGWSALVAAKTGARLVLACGGSSSASGRQALAQLDADLLARNASPGGSADLLAATLFLDFVTRPPAEESPWKK